MSQHLKLFPWLPPHHNDVLREHHYLGPTRGEVYYDAIGVVVARRPPAARNLPMSWAELARWCIVDRSRNAGSTQWSRVVSWLRDLWPDCSTVVSYSDPSAGHNGALYRACNWLWAPTWHRLRPPPSGFGSWDGETKQEVKDRWVFPLRPDPEREAVLRLRDESLRQRFEWAEYQEPRWKRGRPTGGGGDWKRWSTESGAA